MGLFTSYHKLTDEALMKRLQNQDIKAFDILYKRYYKALYSFIIKMMSNRIEPAKDILQDVFLKVYEYPEKFDVNKKFKSWLFTVAGNECRKSYRIKPKENIEDFEFNIPPHSSLEKIELTEFLTKLDTALELVSEEHKETFILKHQSNFTLKEIAEIQGCALGTVKSRLHYTTKFLADKLANYQSILKTADYERI